MISIIQRRGFQYLKWTSPLIKSSRSAASSIDTKEINNFKNLSSIWWDETGEMKALHSLNKLRVALIRDGLIITNTVKKQFIDSSKPLTDVSILEVGCGGGILTEALARIGSNVTGIDAGSEIIDRAKQHLTLDLSLSSNIKYFIDTIEDHSPKHLDKYDAVVASEVLEHVPEKNLFLENCISCIKPGGSIFITTVNKTMASWLAGIIVAENILSLVPRGTHDWDKFVPPHEVQKTLEDCNCRTRIIHGMSYNFLTNTWCWTSDTSINYAIHAVKS